MKSEVGAIAFHSETLLGRVRFNVRTEGRGLLYRASEHWRGETSPPRITHHNGVDGMHVTRLIN